MTPLLPTPTSAAPLATILGIPPQAAARLLDSASVRAWFTPSGILYIDDLIPNHRASAHFYPSTEVKLAEVKDLLNHVFALFRLRVIYAILPVESADASTPLLTRLGFHHQGSLPCHRRSPSGDFRDDLIFSLTSWERTVPPRVIPPASPDARQTA